MDAVPDDTTHGTIPVPTSQEESGLCERCRALEIGTYLESSGQSKFGEFATIAKSSLQLDCRFCKQFHKLLSTTEQSASIAEKTKIQLSRGPISTSDNEDGCHDCCISASYGFVSGGATVYILTLVLYPRPFGNFLTPDIANYDMVKQSLLYCEENHLDGCQPLSPPSSILQLIDCKARKIIPALEGQRYICLSYVWGPNGDGDQNVPLELPINIPKKIEDAMYVAIEIGIPFLWVDRYCINQTNVHQKHTVIPNMDKIYSGANLTIISAAGEDPHHGLPGVRGTPRQSQFQLGGEFCTYFGVLSPEAEVVNSK